MVGVDRRLSWWYPLLLSNEDRRNGLGTSGCLCNPPWNLTGEEMFSCIPVNANPMGITHRTPHLLVDSLRGTA